MQLPASAREKQAQGQAWINWLQLQLISLLGQEAPSTYLALFSPYQQPQHKSLAPIRLHGLSISYKSDHRTAAEEALDRHLNLFCLFVFCVAFQSLSTPGSNTTASTGSAPPLPSCREKSNPDVMSQKTLRNGPPHHQGNNTRCQVEAADG